MLIYPPSAKVISINIDKIIPGDSKRIRSPKSFKDIKNYNFINHISYSFFLHKKTANKYNKKSNTNKSEGKSEQKT